MTFNSVRMKLLAGMFVIGGLATFNAGCATLPTTVILSPTDRAVGTLPDMDTPEALPPKWELIWSDEFESPELDVSKWNIAVGPDGLNNDLQYDTLDDVYIENGHLVLRQQKRDIEGHSYTSGKVTTQNKFSFLYGRVEIRAKPPKGVGFHTAYWLLTEGCSGYAGGDNTRCIWPPEIDIAEILGQNTTTFHTTFHYEMAGTPLGDGQEHNLVIDLSEDFHIYTIEWAPDLIRWFLDDTLVYETDFFVATSHIPMILTLDTCIGGDWPFPPQTTTPFPSYNRIDYIRVYKDANDPNPPTPTPTPQAKLP